MRSGGEVKAGADDFAWSSYPDGNWAIRGRVRPTQSVYVQAGIYFSQSNIYNVAENFRSGFTIDSSYINGEAFPVEVGYEPVFGPDKLPGHYKAGFWYSNNNYTNDYFDVNGSAFAQSGLRQRMQKGASAAYVAVDQMVLRNAPGANSGLIVFGTYFHNDEAHPRPARTKRWSQASTAGSGRHARTMRSASPSTGPRCPVS